MATTYTSGIRATNQPNGGNLSTWGDIADANFELIDDALTARTSVDLTGGTSHTLTTNNGSEDEARAMNLYTHGTMTSALSLIIPASEKMYLIENQATGDTMTVRTATGTGVTFNTGDRQIVYCDGVSVKTYGLTSALDPSENLADLNDPSAAVSNLGILEIDAVESPLEVSGTKLQVISSALFGILYPVGTVYTNTSDNTNPGTLFGMGTWTSLEGRVLVGIGSATDDNGVSATFVSGETGGEFEHTQTVEEMAAHNHLTVNGTNYHTGMDVATSTSGIWYGDHLARRDEPGYGFDQAYVLRGNDNGATEPDRGPTTIDGEGNSFNIQQPYLAAYMWERIS